MPPSPGRRSTVAAGSPVRLYVRSTGTGTSFPIARLAPLKLVRLADGKVMSTLTTGENGVWTGVLRPARTRAYEVRFAGAGQFLAPGSSRSSRDHHRQVGHALHSPDARAERA